ncbi:cysteine hydrolase family protein [Geothrix sp. 21YS21S-4]|uniref:cysteine hydrolase family protein n=1 Tax=Geothrix sp. 21YS21S-4 TaxID=3068889 RepID=UPI0027BB10B6|nr:cysteine hydrolase family protein [Geothrix sp. 21YS21S-4]
MAAALLLIDIQNDYFPGGAMEVVGAEAAAAQAGKLLAAFREKGLPVIHIQHVSARPGATFFLPGTPGAEFHASVQPAPGEAVFKKAFPSAFKETPLLEHLRANGISHLTVAGMMTHMCIDTTLRATADLGLTCALAQDGCATRALAFNGVQVPAENVQAAYLAALNGLFAKVLPTEELCAAL